MQRDIRTLDLNLLKTLEALLDERSVTKAAARLSLTQPAVSGMLTRLREAFGDPLFIRAPRGIVPTPRALELANPIKRLLREVEQMLQPEAFNPGTANMNLAIAATDYALHTIVMPFLATLRLQAPGVCVAVHPIDDSRVNNDLESGKLDLAILTPETTPSGLNTHPLYDERYLCAIREGHPILGEPLTVDRFCELEHAMVSYAGGGFRGVTDEALARIGRKRRVSVSMPSFLVLLDLLKASDLIAVVPSRLVRENEGVVLIEPPLEIAGFSKVLAWHDRTDNDAAMSWLKTLLIETV
ncbi:LysR family transcriptional regulator [Pseudomonas sp. v388]|uniref:LysR family transcriptional regulator n=1 Tax=Pseudomonas sp. v388 TaxID=2479849 RepID=UPI000F7696EF|nr:LysR family transcriptional regulator [Pseudomonas sp. v388]RRV06089.1 LysR family transcriptional regulator [Pseudomonas sp. v388]